MGYTYLKAILRLPPPRCNSCRIRGWPKANGALLLKDIQSEYHWKNHECWPQWGQEGEKCNATLLESFPHLQTLPGESLGTISWTSWWGPASYFTPSISLPHLGQGEEGMPAIFTSWYNRGQWCPHWGPHPSQSGGVGHVLLGVSSGAQAWPSDTWDWPSWSSFPPTTGTPPPPRRAKDTLTQAQRHTHIQTYIATCIYTQAHSYSGDFPDESL